MTDLLPRGGLLVGVDVGGSKIAVLVADAEHQPQARLKLPMAIGAQELAADTIVDAIRAALAEAGAGIADVRAVGVGVPGRIDPVTGTVSLAVNLGWQDLPLGEQLAARLGVPVVLENDVRAAASGLHERRVVGDVDDLAYLSVGTGISAGVVLGGRLHRGVRGMAGEVGHIVLDPDGPSCACGLRGCFEALAAGPAIARLARDAVNAGAGTAMATIDSPTAADVYRAASAGDRVALDIAAQVGEWVARIVHELVMAYDVEVVVLGGGVATAGDAFLDPILRALDRLRAASPLARELLRQGVVHLLPPDADAGTWGAIALAQSLAVGRHRPTPVVMREGEGG